VIYIGYIYILTFIIAIFTRDEEFLSLPGVGWKFAVCAFILPIWFALRQCANELARIRKMMEGKEG